MTDPAHEDRLSTETLTDPAHEDFLGTDNQMDPAHEDRLFMDTLTDPAHGDQAAQLAGTASGSIIAPKSLALTNAALSETRFQQTCTL